MRAATHRAEALFAGVAGGIQQQCQHPQLGEAPVFEDMPRIRLCLTCGMTEEQDADGFTFLVPSDPGRLLPLRRDFVYCHQHGLSLTAKHKVALREGTRTLIQLINAPADL